MRIKLKGTDTYKDIKCIDPRTSWDCLAHHIPKRYKKKSGLDETELEEVSVWALRLHTALLALYHIEIRLAKDAAKKIHALISEQRDQAADCGDYASGIEALVKKWALK